MTIEPMPLPDDDAVDRWLAAQQDDLVGCLTSVLDLDAGLREVQIYARHDDLVEGLGNSLDIEAGLAAILPEPTSGAAPGEPADAAAAIGRQEPLQDRRESQLPAAVLDPQMRLTLRDDPLVRASVISGFVVRALGLAVALSREVVDNFDRADELVLASSFVEDLGRARMRNLVRNSEYEFGGVGSLVPSLREGRRHQPFSLSLSLASKLAVRVVVDLRAPRYRAGALRRLSDRVARDLLACRRSEEVADVAVLHVMESAVRLKAKLNQEVGLLLGLESADGIELDVLYDLLDDFTQADLSTIDLTDINLEGVRWSLYTTRWPPEVDVDRLREKSQETTAGSGIYVIRRGSSATDSLQV